MLIFFWGISAAAAWVAGLFFLRFWTETRDRLFALFAAAFWVLGLSWTVLAAVPPTDETRHYVYLIRLAAFLLIGLAVLDKNRARPRRP
jgi:hypothetical protein